MKKTYNVVSTSAGKDSTATALLAIERQAENILLVFADTGNELPQVYDYLDYLENKLGIAIRRIRANFDRQIAGKRAYVETKWPTKLVADFMADTAGQWVLNPAYAKITMPTDDGVVSFLRCPDGREIEFPDIPPEPSDIYGNAEAGPFLWLPAVKGMSKDEAEHQSGIIIETALGVLHPTGNPFLDLCIWKGRFPSRKAQFCTEELKRNPVFEQVFMPLLEDPDTEELYSWQGIRADESAVRAKYKEIEEVGQGLFNYRPILNWTAQDVFDFHRKHGVKWNPLYEMGMSRVGCAPCINCRKDELHEIASRFPEEIERIAEWERLVSQASKRQGASFFGPGVMPVDIDGLTNQEAMEKLNVHEVVKWSKTARGGRVFDMMKLLPAPAGCSSAYGLCDAPVIDDGQVIFKQKI